MLEVRAVRAARAESRSGAGRGMLVARHGAKSISLERHKSPVTSPESWREVWRGRVRRKETAREDEIRRYESKVAGRIVRKSGLARREEKEGKKRRRKARKERMNGAKE